MIQGNSCHKWLKTKIQSHSLHIAFPSMKNEQSKDEKCISSHYPSILSVLLPYVIHISPQITELLEIQIKTLIRSDVEPRELMAHKVFNMGQSDLDCGSVLCCSQ